MTYFRSVRSRSLHHSNSMGSQRVERLCNGNKENEPEANLMSKPLTKSFMKEVQEQHSRYQKRAPWHDNVPSRRPSTSCSERSVRENFERGSRLPSNSSWGSSTEGANSRRNSSSSRSSSAPPRRNDREQNAKHHSYLTSQPSTAPFRQSSRDTEKTPSKRPNLSSSCSSSNTNSSTKSLSNRYNPHAYEASFENWCSSASPLSHGSLCVDDGNECKHSVSPTTKTRKALFPSFEATPIFQRYRAKLGNTPIRSPTDLTMSKRESRDSTLPEVRGGFSGTREDVPGGDRAEASAMTTPSSSRQQVKINRTAATSEDILERAHQVLAQASITLSASKSIQAEIAVANTYPQPLGGFTSTPSKQRMKNLNSAIPRKSTLAPRSTGSKASCTAPDGEKKFGKRHSGGPTQNSRSAISSDPGLSDFRVMEAEGSREMLGIDIMSVYRHTSYNDSFGCPDPDLHLSFASKDYSEVVSSSPKPDSLLKLATTPRSEWGERTGLSRSKSFSQLATPNGISRIASCAPKVDSQDFQHVGRFHDNEERVQIPLQKYMASPMSGGGLTINRYGQLQRAFNSEKKQLSLRPSSGSRRDRSKTIRRARSVLARRDPFIKDRISKRQDLDTSVNDLAYPIPTHLKNTEATKSMSRSSGDKPKPVTTIRVADTEVDSDEDLTAPTFERRSFRPITPSPERTESTPDSIFTMGLHADSKADPAVAQPFPRRAGESDEESYSTMSTSVFDVNERKARSRLAHQNMISGQNGQGLRMHNSCTSALQLLANKSTCKPYHVSPETPKVRFADENEPLTAFAIDSPSALTEIVNDRRQGSSMFASAIGRLLKQREGGGNDSNEREEVMPQRNLWVDCDKPQTSRKATEKSGNGGPHWGGPGEKYPTDQENPKTSCFDLFHDACIPKPNRGILENRETAKSVKYEAFHESSPLTKDRNDLFTPRTATSPGSVFFSPEYSTRLRGRVNA